MKRLIIAVAAAAVGISAQAKSAKELDAQVYDFSATVKSTQCKEIKWTKSLAQVSLVDFADVKGARVEVRKQASTKIAGVIWGCNCGTIAEPGWRIYPGSLWPTIGGYLFWNTKSGIPFNIATTAFGWALFDRIDDGTKVEGVWALVNDDANNALAFLGAGFGKATVNSPLSPRTLTVPQDICRPVLSSMSGNFAGFLLSGSDADGCMFCGSAGCLGLPFCWCVAPTYNPYTVLTAAYGTWNIKYNKTASNKLRKNGLLSESYSFKKGSAARTILANVEAAVANGTLASEDDEYADLDPEEYVEGEPVDKADVAKHAYSPADPESYEEPEKFSESGEESPIVTALLSIASGDAS